MSKGINLNNFTAFPYKGIKYLITGMFFTDSSYLPPQNINLSEADFEKCFEKRQKVEIDGSEIKFLPISFESNKIMEEYLEQKNKFVEEQVQTEIAKPLKKSYFKFDELQIFYTEDKKNVYLIGAYYMDVFEGLAKENCEQFYDFAYYVNTEEKLVYLTGVNKNKVNFFLAACSLIQIIDIEGFKRNLEELEFLKTAEYVVSKDLKEI